MNLFKILSFIVFSMLIGTTQVYGQYGGGPTQSSANDYTVSISLDKDTFKTDEIISFSGTVNKYDEKRSLQVTVFNSANKLVLNTEISVESDGTFSFDLSSTEKFPKEGQYELRAQYGKTRVNVEIISFTVIPAEPKTDDIQKSPESGSNQVTEIPDWIKNNAGWWADGQIDDNSFVQGIQFMIKEGMMKIPPTDQGSSSGSNEIPDWIKNNAGWWADGQIDDNSFVQGIQFMIKEGLMTISS
jgi:hypothetical protein